MIVSPWHPSARTAGWATICKESFSVHTATPWPEPPSSLAWTTSIDSYKACVHAKSLQSCPTLCNPMDSSAPGSFFHGIFQARILEWVFLQGSSQLRDQTHVSYVSCTSRQVLYHMHYLGSLL